MIQGLGIDIVRIERIRELYMRFGNRFLTNILSDNEIISIGKSPDMQHLAGIFAAKEAIIKSLDININYPSIEIYKYLNKPTVKIDLNSCDERKIKISISHEKEYAVAVAIVEK